MVYNYYSNLSLKLEEQITYINYIITVKLIYHINIENQGFTTILFYCVSHTLITRKERNEPPQLVKLPEAQPESASIPQLLIDLPLHHLIACASTIEVKKI